MDRFTVKLMIVKNYTWEPRGKKKPRGFLNFPRDVKMGFEEIYPRGIFIDLKLSTYLINLRLLLNNFNDNLFK